ncbi:MAG: MBL fold metallo-hydrolase, partial [Ruminococcaceae bacterium]|nr:MBL fold metallo-hydrolase [Oscillospiraceae bacterium]
MKAARRKSRWQRRKQKLKKSAGGYAFIALVVLAMILAEVTLERCVALQQCAPTDWEPISGAEQVPVGGLQVHCIDTGQGSCTLVRSSEACVLIDAGGTADEDVPVNYLRKLGIERLVWVICTHLHKDHINAMDEVVRAIPIDNIALGEVPVGLEPDTDTFTLTGAIERRGLTAAAVRQGDMLQAGDITITVLAPLPPEPEEPVT